MTIRGSKKSTDRAVPHELEALMVGPSDALRKLREEIGALARAGPRSVLVIGETGVGKDLVARGLSCCGAEGSVPIEVFNCPAIPSDHLESELFGTARGAYPGALDRAGAAERADGGILVLDEVGSMTVSHQGKLLRLLENGEARRLGGRRPYRVDLRVVAATNEDLHRAMEQGRFRRDLYYRLVQDGVLRIPPLRERPEDIEPIAALFLAELSPPPRIDSQALDRLRAHRWPGNVRELRAVVRSASHLAGGGAIGPRHVEEAMDRIGTHDSGGQASAPALSATHSGGFHGRIRDVRRQLLLEALAASDGNRTRAGILLGLHHRHDRHDRHDALGLAHDEPELGLAARKRAHRKFDYWWRLLVDAPPAGNRPPDLSFLI